MVPMFLVSFIRAQTSWQRCNENGGPCFPYPIYLEYEVEQCIDLHWLALLPAAAFKQLPDSLTPIGDRGIGPVWWRYAVTFFSVGAFWWLIGLWWERLVLGHRLSPNNRIARIGIFISTGILGPLTGLAVYLGIQGGYEGPTMTDAGFLPPLTLVMMACLELGVIPTYLSKPGVRVAIATLLVFVYREADVTLRSELQEYEAWSTSNTCRTEPGAVCLPFTPSPLIQDAMALQAPVVLITELPSALFQSRFPFESPIAVGFRYLLTGAYWFILVSLLSGKWPTGKQTYVTLRGWLRAVCGLAFALSFLTWLFARLPHGPTGIFGVVIGTGIALYALRRAPLQMQSHPL